MAAVEAGVDIMPIVLKYTHIDGQPFGPENADKVAWHGDMSFAPHLVELVKLKQVKCRLEFLPPIKVTPESTRNDLADKTYKAITDVYFTNHVPRPEQPVGPA
jgi:1-acyl-sn-glycerol-3-phosphate acyltransferase